MIYLLLIGKYAVAGCIQTDARNRPFCISIISTKTLFGVLDPRHQFTTCITDTTIDNLILGTLIPRLQPRRSDFDHRRWEFCIFGTTRLLSPGVIQISEGGSEGGWGKGHRSRGGR
jgi:hypothetical protein